MQAAPEGFLSIPDFLSEEEQTALLRELRTMDYRHDIFRGQRLKRSYAQFGYAYVSSGRRLEATAPMPESLQAVIHKAKAYRQEDTVFNQCIVTHYPPGSGIGWHTDGPRFGENIVGVSLGSEARFQPRPNGTDEAS